ncbi:hypothetical protein B0H12DRAFT_1072890 [Mycena haematopus]|nr:hypothetical protein B0H12DRAFT_1072890 [Mycena haematopus]
MVGSLFEFSSTTANLDIVAVGGRLGLSSESESESDTTRRRGGGGGGKGGDGGRGGEEDCGGDVKGDVGELSLRVLAAPRFRAQYGESVNSESFSSFGGYGEYPGGDNGGKSRRGSLDHRRSITEAIAEVEQDKIESAYILQEWSSYRREKISNGHAHVTAGLQEVAYGEYEEEEGEADDDLLD